MRPVLSWLITNVMLLVVETTLAAVYEPIDTARVLDAVTVYGSHNPFGPQSSQMSAVRVTPEFVKTMPTMLGELDVMKALHMLPGVQPGDVGGASVYVRGGSYDQNYITLDGVPLYRAEHMAGFASAIDPDMVGYVDLYKGAFPAHLGTRLSSYINTTVKEGDMLRYHASGTLSLSGARVQVEGPIIKGTTSFNLGVRKSFYNLLTRHYFESLEEHNEESIEEEDDYYSLDYIDVTAKLTHKLRNGDKLTLTGYFSKDIHDAKIYTSDNKNTSITYAQNSTIPVYKTIDERLRKEGTLDHWHNLMGSLKWQTVINNDIDMATTLRATHFRNEYNHQDYNYKSHYRYPYNQNKEKFESEHDWYSYYFYDEGIVGATSVTDAAISADFAKLDNVRNSNWRWGTVLNYYHMNSYWADKNILTDECTDYGENIYRDISNVNRFPSNMVLLALYGENDWEISQNLKMNLGLRLSAEAMRGKSYFDIEPRMSMRYLTLGQKVAVKASYSRSSQPLYRIESTSVVLPVDFWTCADKDIKPMISDQLALGLEVHPNSMFDISVEGYYKWMDNVNDLREGWSPLTSYSNASDMICQGKAWTYGVEAFAQKTFGEICTWMVSYTWQKALNRFDRPGQEIMSGRTFYSANDRRHNFNIQVKLMMAKHTSLNCRWTYMTGKRGSLRDLNLYLPYATGYYGTPGYSNNGDPFNVLFENYTTFLTNNGRNDYVMPAVHHLDISIEGYHKYGNVDAYLSIGVYNVYNRYNVSRVFLSSDSYWNVKLKGVCNFPLTPSLSLTFAF